MSPRHPLAKGPKGDGWFYGGGIVLLIVFALSIRWAKNPTVPVQPVNPPQTQVFPTVSGPAVSLPQNSAQPIPMVATFPAVSPVVTGNQPVQIASPATRIIPTYWKFSLDSPAVNAVLQTPTGVIWAATENGLIRIEGDQISTLNQENGLFPAPSATCLAHDGKTLWIGTFDGLFQTTDGSSFRKFTTEEGLAHNMIWSLESRGSILWVGTQQGFSFSLNDGRFEKIDKKISNGGLADVWVNSIKQLDKWTLCGNDDGISIWDTMFVAANPSGWVTLDMFSTNLAHNFILAILVENKRFWLGTPQGLCHLQVDIEKLFGGIKGNFQTYTRRNGLPSDRIDTLAKFDNDLWVGTPAGLSRFRNGRFQNLSYKDGLLATDVRTISATGNWLWVGTSGGLQAMDPKEFR